MRVDPSTGVDSTHALVADEVRAAELTATLCLATDLAIELPLEHGLHSTLVAMRLAHRLGVDESTAAQTYYGCLLFHAGCTAGLEVSSELFDDGALASYFNPVMFASPHRAVAGIVRALGGHDGGVVTRAVRVGRRLPRAVRARRANFAAGCEVAEMVSDRFGMPPVVRGLFAHLLERWDGRGEPVGLRGDEIPLPVRIIHVARDAAFQHLLGGAEHAAGVVHRRGGAAFDPQVVDALAADAEAILTIAPDRPAWDDVLAGEPGTPMVLSGPAVDEALAGVGDFADLVSPYLVSHSSGVARLAGDAARGLGYSVADELTIRRSALLHDIGRVAVPARVWRKAAPLTTDEWERVRLHPYYSDRVLSRSPFLAALAAIAAYHHECQDGSGYHRGLAGGALPRPARLLAAADAYHAMTEPRAHRDALPPERAAELLIREARAGRWDSDSVAAVLDVAGHARPRLPRPAGLTEREAEVLRLLARGLQTKQIGRTLGITPKTAGNHVQNAYAKIGVSTRAAAAMFAMRHGLVP